MRNKNKLYYLKMEIDELEKEINNLTYIGSPPLTGMPHSNSVNSPTEQFLIKKQRLIEKLNNLRVIYIDELETMEGIISNIDEIKTIIDGVIYKDKIGVCFDTCHVNDSGYDLSNPDELLKELVDSLLTLEEEIALLNDQKQAAIAVLESKLSGNYKPSDLEEIKTIVDNYKEQINNAKSETEIISLKVQALTEIAEYKEDPLIALRRTTLLEAEEYANSLTTPEVGKNRLSELLTTLENDLEKADSTEAIEQLLKQFKTDAKAVEEANPVNPPIEEKEEEEDEPKKRRFINCLNAVNIVPFISLLGIVVITLFKRKN